MSQYASLGVGYSASAPTEKQLLIREKHTPQDGTRRAIICLHGHGGDATQFTPRGAFSTAYPPGYHAWQLAEAGLLVIAVDDAGTTSWTDAAAMSRLDDAYAYAMAQGAKAGKVGLMGWSMGGSGALNWTKRNATKVACVWLWSPLTDLDWANTTSGYTPAYTSFAAPGSWATEIQTDFNPYATASVGYRIRDEYASWRGLGIPIKVCHASDDTAVPPGQSSAFVTGVNDVNVTLRSPAPTGDHSGQFANVPAYEVVSFFADHL